jgi:hypothetical protein
MSFERQALAVLIAFSGSCVDWERGPPSPDTGMSSANDAGMGGATDAAGEAAARLSYATAVHPLMIDGCAHCHSAAGSARSSAFILSDNPTSDRQQVLKYVNPDNPAASRILAKTAGMGHGGGTVYAATTLQYRTILDWITQGSAP